MKVAVHKDELELTETSVVIRKRGLANAMASGMNGERSVLYGQITSVGFKVAGKFSPGFIQFSHAGGKPFRGGLIEATQDPDSLVFGKEFNERMEVFRAEIERRRTTVTKSSPTSTSLSNEVEKLALMRDRGLLTDDEFNNAKAKLFS